jgi:phenylalanyl-tRNA synthetase beta subunit
MKFSFHWIQELSGTVRTAQEVAELLNARSFEVKDIVEGPRDTVLDIDILPNRPDALSHLNVAREVCALEGRLGKISISSTVSRGPSTISFTSNDRAFKSSATSCAVRTVPDNSCIQWKENFIY